MDVRRFGVLDIGASGGRALVATTDGRSVTLEEVHRFDNRPVTAASGVYWDILRILQDVGQGIQRLHAATGNLESIAIDTWGCDFGFIDDHGRLVGNPFTYRDPARRASIEAVEAVISPQELYERAGTPLDSIMSIYQLKAMVDTNSAEAAVGSHFLMIPDLLVYFLTGEIVNEFTNATMSLLVNQHTRSWDTELIERLGMQSQWFTQLRESGTLVGRLSASVAQSLGVPRIPVVVPATHDTASAVAGLPVAASTAPGSWAFVSLGTWAICGFESDTPRTTSDVREAGFGNEGGVDGSTLVVRNLTGLWILQECSTVWAREEGAALEWPRVLAASDEAEPFASFIDIDDPRFGSVAADMTQLIKDYCTGTGQRTPLGMGQVARCAYESLVMKIRQSVRDLERISGSQLTTLHIVGGGIQNTRLCQWIADATGLSVTAGPVETTSVGNALMQLKAAGMVSTIREAREISSRSFDLANYEPQATGLWDAAYERYAAVISR